MGVAVLVFVGVVIGGARAAPTSEVSPPELTLQPPHQVGVPSTYITRHHAQDELGQVNYGFTHPGQTKNEVRDATGNVAGTYSFVNADNKVVVVKYTAGDKGFQVSSNTLPVGVTDTPEVLAAKLQFVEQYNAAALAAASASDDESKNESPLVGSGSLSTGIPVPSISTPVKDTAEVVAAKLQFVEAYNAASLAAANAPDTAADSSVDLDSGSEASINPNPVKDTPEVINAKLKFVEAYNAAALAAAKGAANPKSIEDSKLTIIYAVPVVEDTPEVRRAKLNFVDEYNKAALAAGGDQIKGEGMVKNVSPITDNPSEIEEPVTELGIISGLKSANEQSPNEGSEDVEPTTLLPFVPESDGREARNFNELFPVKVETPNNFPAEELTSRSGARVNVPQAHSYGSGSPEASRSTVLQDQSPQSVSQDQVDIETPHSQVYHHHVQDELGQVSYGYSYPGHSKNEQRFADGSVVGNYAYINDENKIAWFEYTAGKDGFQVESNSLPISVSDTPEVVAAKLEFVEAYNAAALRAAAAPDDSDAGDYQNVAVFEIPSPVKDTPEVLAAKLQFAKLYNAAALAAANAPDNAAPLPPVVGGDLAGVMLTDINPVKDTPEVTAAKLQFVEAYNAASLAAAMAIDDPEHDDTSKATVVFAPHPVQDTPEVIAAKMRFVEEYNAAALAAAIAPDDDEASSVAVSQGSSIIPPEFKIVQAIHLGEGSPLQEPASPSVSPVRNENILVDPISIGLSAPSAQTSDQHLSSLSAGEPLVGLPVSLPTTLQAPSLAFPITYISRHHAQDELGQVNYGYSYPGVVKNEVRDASGNVAGAYSYTDSDDNVIEVEYTAGKGGFQVKSNNVPVAPSDTPEVLAAKLEFVEAYNAAALAAALAPDHGEASSADSSFNPPTPVKDTPEVIAAKLQFVEDYNAAALAAANAPDDPVQHYSSNSEPENSISVNSNPVRDTPEIIAAKLRFVDAYNVAALATAKADGSESQAIIANAHHAVKDTPEVIAAKLKFVEAYNAAALLAALAPDDDENGRTTLKPDVSEDKTLFEELTSEEPATELPSLDQNQVYFSQDSASIDKTNTDTVKPATETGTSQNKQQHYTVIGSSAPYISPLSRYAGFSAQPVRSPILYTYSTHYNLNGIHPVTLQKGSPYTYFVPFQMIKQDQSSVDKHFMYAPLHTTFS